MSSIAEMTPVQRGWRLLELAAKRFSGELTAAEALMFRCAGEGRDANMGDALKRVRAAWLKHPTDQRIGPAEWDLREKAQTFRFALDDYRVRADRLRWLLVEPAAQRLTDPSGVVIIGAIIEEPLDLNQARIARAVQAERCLFTRAPNLMSASLPGLYLNGSLLPGLEADRLSVKGGVVLSDGFTATGEVRLPGATIGGQLNCFGGTFHNPGGFALNADVASVKGGVFLSDDFTATGEVRLPGATIGGQLACAGGTFHNPGGFALNADEASVKCDVFLSDGFTATGEVRLPGATIGGVLSCIGGKFRNRGGFALSADRASVKGGVFLSRGFTAKGEVRLLGATIGGVLSCIGGRFRNPGQRALQLEGATVNGNVRLDDRFKAHGEVRLDSATVRGSLSAIGGIFHNPGGFALSCHGSRFGQRVYLRASGNGHFKARGSVAFLGATLERGLNAGGGHFDCPEPAGDAKNFYGVDLTNVTSAGDINFGEWTDPKSGEVHGTKVRGTLCLDNARIRGTLDFGGGTFQSGGGGTAIRAHGATVERNVFLNRRSAKGKAFEAVGLVELTGIRVREGVYLCEGRFATSGQGGGAALSLERARIAGLLQLDSHQLRVDGDAPFGPAGKMASRIKGDLILSHARVGVLRDDPATWSTEPCELDCSPLKVKRVEGDVLLDGFVYDALDPASPWRAHERLALLRRMPAGTFSTQPYEHLAKLLDEMGHDDEAREVLISEARARQRFELDQAYADLDRTHSDKIGPEKSHQEARCVLRQVKWELAVLALMSFAIVILRPGLPHTWLVTAIALAGLIFAGYHTFSLPLRKVGLKYIGLSALGITLMYGFKPMRALAGLALLWAVGTVVFTAGWRNQLLVPGSDQVITDEVYRQTKQPPAEYPKFDALMYSADVMLPIIDLQQERWWLPDAAAAPIVESPVLHLTWGRLLRTYFWLHILSGWTLTSLFIVGLTGLVRGHKAEQVSG